MNDPLKDELNLRLLRYLVSGEGVKVNISAVARRLDIHRATAKKKAEYLYEMGIINPPLYPFAALFDEYPILVIVEADMPRDPDITTFYREDSHIFAAFSCMEGPYNTLLIEFFRNLESYHSWREKIVQEMRIPAREWRAPANAYIFSNKLTFKYDPNCFINVLVEEFKAKGEIDLNGVSLDSTEFRLLKMLMSGECIRTNESLLARKLSSNRKTIGRHIESLIDAGIINRPRCIFPNLFIPPGYNLVVSRIEVKSHRDEFKDLMIKDHKVSRALVASTGRYNFLVFTAFKTIENFFDWGDKLYSRFPDSIGAVSNTILSSKMIHTIMPQKVSIGMIERRLRELE
ncbi:MAG: hypothetical protein R6U17_09150 [Thermoplasmata archaeon]